MRWIGSSPGFSHSFMFIIRNQKPPKDHKNPQELYPHLCNFPSDGPTNSSMIPHSHEVSCQFIIHPSICPSIRPSVCPSTWQSFPVGWCRRLLFRCWLLLMWRSSSSSGSLRLRLWRKLTPSTCISLSCFGVCPQLTVTDEGRKLRKHTSTSPTSLQTLHSPLIYEQDPKIFAGAETPLFSTLSTMTLWSFVCRKKSNKAHIGVDVKPDFTGWDLWGATAVVFMGV